MQFFEFAQREKIGFLGLNRPRCANAYNRPMLLELRAFLEQHRQGGDMSVLVLHGGNSRHFCAGADLKELAGRTCLDGLELLARAVFEEVACFPLPTIAAIHGAALGGGLELALACDLRLGTPDCQLGFPEPSKGLIPAAGGCGRASRLLGAPLAKEMILFGRRLSGQEAWQRNAISELAPASELLDCAARWAHQAASHSYLANRLAKRAIDAVQDVTPALALEGVSQAVLYEQARRA